MSEPGKIAGVREKARSWLRSFAPGAASVEPRAIVDDWSFYFEGDDFFRALERDLRAAEQSIFVEMYILSDDEVGARFMEILREKSLQGVRVRLLVDGVGSLTLSPISLERMRLDGVRVRIYHPLELWSLFRSRVWRRNHRKLIIIDNKICHLGGMNISRELSRRVFGSLRWRDTMMRLRGEIARDARLMFEGMWSRSARRFLRRRNTRPAVGGSPGFLLVENTTLRRRRRHRREYLGALRSARETIIVQAAYFIPRYAILHILKSKARKGVEVVLIISRESDVPAARWAGRSVFASLMKSGVRILEYRERFLHAKTTIVDDRLAILGSSNLDYQSLLRNQEVDLIIRREDAVAELRRGVENDMRNCVRIVPEEWKHRPWRERILEKFFYLFKYYL